MKRFDDIGLLRITYLRGPNIWTYRPVMEVWLDLGELGQTLSRESATRTDIDVSDLGGGSDFCRPWWSTIAVSASGVVFSSGSSREPGRVTFWSMS